MARKQETTETDNSEFNLDETPEEITGPTPELTAEEDNLFLDAVIDKTEHEELMHKLNPPKGDWVKEDEFERFVFIVKGDCQKGDVNPEGRTKIVFSGYPHARIDQDNNEHQPLLKFYISPDVRYSTSNPNKLDKATELYQRAIEMYTSKHGEMPKTRRDLLLMLELDTYVINTWNADTGLQVGLIKWHRNKK